MHMSDALLSPAVGAAFWTGTLAAISLSARKLRSATDDRLVPLMGVLGAFIFAAQMVNFTIPGTGSSGHLGGGMLLSIMLGPSAAFLVIASVLIVQAFFFADGGLLALGCNIWNLGIYPCFIAYSFIYKPFSRGLPGPGRLIVASLLSAVAGLQLGAFSVVLQTLLSGRSELPFGAFAMLMQPIHLAIGLVEGFITAGIVNFVRSVRPEILQAASTGLSLDRAISIKRIFVIFCILAIFTGGVLSWFASSDPDGLEWAIGKVTGGAGLSEHEGRTASGLKNVQEQTAFLPDYGFRKHAETKGGQTDDQASKEAGTPVSGIVGALLVLALVFGIGLGIRLLHRRPGHQ